jgi:hypothetical protein
MDTQPDNTAIVQRFFTAGLPVQFRSGGLIATFEGNLYAALRRSRFPIEFCHLQRSEPRGE